MRDWILQARWCRLMVPSRLDKFKQPVTQLLDLHHQVGCLAIKSDTVVVLMSKASLNLQVTGMHCTGCEHAIESAAGNLAGVESVKADHLTARVLIEFNSNIVTQQAIESVIRSTGYNVVQASDKKWPLVYKVLLFAGLLALVGGVAFWGKSLMPGVMQQMNAELSYAMLFGIGFLTGFHCIGMCGSFIVSYADATRSNAAAAVAHFSYGAGKTISYSVIGAGFGLLGAALTITPVMRGSAAILAGLFLLLFGLKMLNVIKSMGVLSLRLPDAFVSKVNKQINLRKNPLLIGLLSGLLLGCGPLQAMYIMAAGTGSPGEGATLLFFFGLGTLPPLLGFGFFASFLSRKTIHDMIKVSGILVIIMGAMMLNRGLTMTGSGLDAGSVWQWLTSMSG